MKKQERDNKKRTKVLVAYNINICSMHAPSLLFKKSPACPGDPQFAKCELQLTIVTDGGLRVYLMRI